MPLLPKKNSLDYNPDSTIFASKKMSSIALENMKNPLEDPDTQTLSTLAAQKSLGDTFDKLEELAGTYSSLVLRLGSLLAKEVVKIKKKVNIQRGSGRRLYGGVLTPAQEAAAAAAEADEVMEEVSGKKSQDNKRFRDVYEDDDKNSFATPAKKKKGGRPKGSKNIKKAETKDEPKLAESKEDEEDEEDEEIEEIDDDAIPPLPTARSSAKMDFGDDKGDGDGGEPFAMFDPLGFVGEQVGANFNSLIFPLIQIVRRMNMLMNSRVRPAIFSLTAEQISKATEIYEMVKTSYNDVIYPDTRRFRKDRSFRMMPRERFGDLEEAIIEQNEFGDEILSLWNTEINNLLLNLTTIINSWKQNTPTGQQISFNDKINKSFQNTATRLGRKAELVDAGGQPPYEGYNYKREITELEPHFEGAGRKKGRPKKNGDLTLIGNGRNFYGEKIDNSRDLPTLFSGAIKNCATKYLL
jgi:hypothetical protein